jgi:ATP synthase protein I
MVGLGSKAVRTVLVWQLIATAILAGISAWIAGWHGALSATLGGLVSFIAGLAFAGVASASRSNHAGIAMLAALRAEAVKILVIVVLLWLVLATYKSVVIVAFIGTFIVATLVFSSAIFVSEDRQTVGKR